MKKLLLYFLIIAFHVSCSYQDILKNDHQSLKELLQDSSLINKPLTLLIDKSDYKLSVVVDSLVIKEYPVVFGGNPKDDKLMQGDQCTPEGSFKMRDKYPHRSWSKFIWIDYPNEDSWEKHNQAKENGKIPEDAGIGGEIGIHGVPEGMDFLIDLKRNWTLGCISLKNSDINEIYPWITTNTVIQITP